MLKKIVSFVVVMWAFAGAALAAVEVNTADQPALDSVAGIGPSTSKAILSEREKNGNFKDWSDLERRVKGIGDRNAVKLSAAGLTVNGKSFDAASGEHKAAKPSKSAGKPADASAEKPSEKMKP